MTTAEINSEGRDLETLVGQFKGEYGPYEDEIYVRKYYEKNKNTPVFKGAYSKCRINGITSKLDSQKYSDWMWRSLGTVSFTMLFFLSSLGLLNSLKILSEEKIRSGKFVASFAGSSLLISIPFIYYKYRTMNKELDIKYTPLYLKSKGKL